jgi:hypothetical protein
MKRSLSRKMSREEVIASMANKLAERSIVNKKKYHRKFLLVNFVVILLSGIMLLLISMSKKTIQQKQSNSFLLTINVIQKPLHRIKNAFENGEIEADEYALYMAYLLVRYDSVPEKFQTLRPKVKSEEVYSELNSIWERVSLRMRQKITSELLPHFRFKAREK